MRIHLEKAHLSMHAHKSKVLQVFFHIKGNKLGHRIAAEKCIYILKQHYLPALTLDRTPMRDLPDLSVLTNYTSNRK